MENKLSGLNQLNLNNANAGPIQALASMDAVSDECAGCEDAPAPVYACKAGDDQCESSTCGHMPIHVEDCQGPGPCEVARVDCSLAHGYYADVDNCQGYCFCSGEVDTGTGVAVPSRWGHCPENTFYTPGCQGFHGALATGFGYDGGCCQHPRDIKSGIENCPGFCPLLSKYHCDKSPTCGWNDQCNCCLGNGEPVVVVDDPVINKVDNGPCGETLDLVFIIDGSKSVKQERFDKSKEFFKKVVMSQNPGSQVAVITYSEEITLNFEFTSDYNSIISQIDDVKYPGRTTRTGKALKFATDNVMPFARPGVRTVVIVLTDGVSYDRRADKIEVRAPELHATGAQVYAIGVGDADKEQLDMIASQSDLSIYSQKTDWEALNDPAFIAQIAGNICNKKK